MGDKSISQRIADASTDIQTTQLELSDEPRTELEGYGESSDVAAHVHCSECEERLEMVMQNGMRGFICGCKDTPERFVIDPM